MVFVDKKSLDLIDVELSLMQKEKPAIQEGNTTALLLIGVYRQ